MVADSRYTKASILRAERMYGEDFQSHGGVETVEEACQRLGVQPGWRVLEVGSGLGGAAFHLAHRYGAQVVGLDASPDMIQLSETRRRQKGLDNVEFQLGDLCAQDFPPIYDLVWARDCLLHLSDKAAGFRRLWEALKPGGMLYIADSCRPAYALSAEFTGYLQECDYHLLDLQDYAETLRQAGFTLTVAEDQTRRYADSLVFELERLTRTRESFLRDFSEDDFNYLVGRWQKKIHFCETGHLRWGVFLATK